MSTQDTPKNTFRNSMGVRFLRGLFFEETNTDKSSVVYTLKDQDHLGYPSLYRLYMEAADLTEYRFATTYLDGWEHWEQLTQCSWFKPYVERWRRELETKIRAQALAAIRAVAADDKHPSAYHANKYLLDGSWKPAGEKKVGRPTKEAIKREAALIVSNEQQVASDYDRVIKKVN